MANRPLKTASDALALVAWAGIIFVSSPAAAGPDHWEPTAAGLTNRNEDLDDYFDDKDEFLERREELARSGPAPKWIRKGIWKDGKVLFGVGALSGISNINLALSTAGNRGSSEFLKLMGGQLQVEVAGGRKSTTIGTVSGVYPVDWYFDGRTAYVLLAKKLTPFDEKVIAYRPKRNQILQHPNKDAMEKEMEVTALRTRTFSGPEISEAEELDATEVPLVSDWFANNLPEEPAPPKRIEPTRSEPTRPPPRPRVTRPARRDLPPGIELPGGPWYGFRADLDLNIDLPEKKYRSCGTVESAEHVREIVRCTEGAPWMVGSASAQKLSAEQVATIARHFSEWGVTGLRLAPLKSGARIWALLDALPGLTALSFMRGGKLGKKELAAIGRLEELRYLELGKFDAAGFKSLKNLKQLTHLDATGGKLANRDLATLRRFGALRHLALRPSPKASKGALATLLAAQKGLERLVVIDAAKIDDMVIGSLARSAELEQLSLPGASLSLQGLAPFLGRKQLRVLEIHGARIDDGALRALASLPLERLDLPNSPITDEGLAYIGKITTLRFLSLDGARITGPGLASLKNLQKLNTLSMRKTKVDNASIMALAELRLLSLVDVRGSRVTSAGTRELDSVTNSRMWVRR